MGKAALGLLGVLGLFSSVSPAIAESQDYSVLIISRERLEVATTCEIGIYLNDQLSGRVFQEDSVSFNLPAGQVDIRLRLLPGQAPGCDNGIENQRSQRFTLQNGQINKYRIASGQNGLYLKKADLNY
ncbi:MULTISPECIES: hypothetical protein [unclassified Pseudomonas]|uniref:hypothetical protein n=1 Tax=unclassified Pseudomonas TaxID=196821 RepID=UPI000BA39F76|nr:MULTISPECIES: hypothetical protein [unclassified Pseudomonas]MCU1724002.1 hypothetical protein [Pseudomonas sp. 5P_5.1_Bac1]MCU1730525.1 hypothetical protein [Pseudomonas sp. 20P_3.2_Bac4]MCU1746450.1 hypothetical protein [Pseudomonas sp. 20P_3.2_Bac5]